MLDVHYLIKDLHGGPLSLIPDLIFHVRTSVHLFVALSTVVCIRKIKLGGQSYGPLLIGLLLEAAYRSCLSGCTCTCSSTDCLQKFSKLLTTNTQKLQFNRTQVSAYFLGWTAPLCIHKYTCIYTYVHVHVPNSLWACSSVAHYGLAVA